MAQLFICLNIPLSKVDSVVFQKFSQQWCRSKAPDRSTISKYYLPRLYKERVERIRKAIGDSPIYLQVDEFQQRPLVSILIGALDGKKPRSYLIDVIRLEKAPDSSKIAQIIGETGVLQYCHTPKIRHSFIWIWNCAKVNGRFHFCLWALCTNLFSTNFCHRQRAVPNFWTGTQGHKVN